MRFRNRVLAAVSGLAVMGAACNAWASAGTCSSLNGRVTNATFPGGDFGLYNFTAGDVVTIQNLPQLGSVTVNLTGAAPFNVTVSPSTTRTITATTTGIVNLTFISIGVTPETSTIIFTCRSAPSPSSPSSSSSSSSSSVAASAELALNASAGTTNGQQTLQSYSDWVTRSVVNSFTGNGGGTASAHGQSAAAARVERLAVETRELATEIADLKAQGTDEAELAERSYRLERLQLDLMLARALAAPTDKATYSRPAPDEAETRSWQIQEEDRRPVPSLSLNGRDLAGFCSSTDTCEPIDRRWNVWLEGRILGAADSVAQTNAFGVNGLAGFDYKVLPWLAPGLSAGVESYNTTFGTTGVVTRSTGFSISPYVGIRLDNNVFASLFLGLSSLTYNNTPAFGVSANFPALRFYFGGSLSGMWRDGPWRFQPTLQGAYGTETQYGYTDSAGTAVPGQTIDYGRVAAGQEIGYTIGSDQAGATVEPFVTARGALDFATNNVGVFGGTVSVVRSGTIGSGSLGLGFNLNFDAGFYARVQGSYDSIGVTGLDLWTGTLRGGIRI